MKNISAGRFIFAFGAIVGAAVARGAPPVSSAEYRGSSVVRRIDDPQAGLRWLLLKNTRNPAGPGRLVPASVENVKPGAERVHRPTAGMLRAYASRQIPVIRAGDALVVEDESAVARIRLEGIAMMPAAAGANLKVRLKVGGQTINATALGPGHAWLSAQFVGQP